MDHKSSFSWRKKSQPLLSHHTQILKNLKKSVEHGANGTKEYVIKKGINKGKIAK